MFRLYLFIHITPFFHKCINHVMYKQINFSSKVMLPPLIYYSSILPVVPSVVVGVAADVIYPSCSHAHCPDETGSNVSL